MENQEQTRERPGHSRRRDGHVRHDDRNSYEQTQASTRTRTRSQSGAGRSSPIATGEQASSRATTSPTSVLESMPPPLSPLPPPPPPPRDVAAASPVPLEPTEEEGAESDVELEEEVVEFKFESDPAPEPVSVSVPISSPGAKEAGPPEAPAPLDRQQKKQDSQEQHDLQKAEEDAKIAALKAMILELQAEEQALIKRLRGEGSAKEIVDRHIQQLHEYNEIKDVGQVILGKCAELEGTTIKQQYENYGLDPTD